MIYLDASVYLSALMPSDNNHQPALDLLSENAHHDHWTSQATLAEALTVGSQRFDKKITIDFIQEVINKPTTVVLEDHQVVTNTWKIFKKISNKNISWVDCYSLAITQHFKIDTILTFDKHFKKIINQLNFSVTTKP